MIKKILLITIILLTILMVSCGDQKPVGPTFDPFVGGTDGLVMNFVPGMPPDTEGAILDNGKSTFSIGLKLSNNGEYDVDPTNNDLVDLRVRGILPQQFGLNQADLEKKLTDPLPGAKKNIDGSVLPGQSTVLSFDDLSYLPDAQGDVPKTFVVDLCYDYMTKSTTPICVASDVTASLVSSSDNSICSVSEPKSTKNSAGPVQISEFKEQPQGGNKVSLTFTVTHVGQGSIFEYHDSNNENPCDDSITNQNRNDVLLDIYLPDQSSATISCGGQFTESDGGKHLTGTVKLFEGNPRIVTCTVASDAPEGSIYEDLLEIDMHYRYEQSLKKTVVVKDIGSANQE